MFNILKLTFTVQTISLFPPFPPSSFPFKNHYLSLKCQELLNIQGLIPPLFSWCQDQTCPEERKKKSSQRNFSFWEMFSRSARGFGGGRDCQSFLLPGSLFSLLNFSKQPNNFKLHNIKFLLCGFTHSFLPDCTWEPGKLAKGPPKNR